MEPVDRSPRSWWPFAVLFGLLLVVGLATSPGYGLASDVGDYFVDSMGQLRWLHGFLHGFLTGHPGPWLDPRVVTSHWNAYPSRIPHPPLSRELAGLAWAVWHHVLGLLASYRLPTVAAWAGVAAGAGAFAARARQSTLDGWAVSLAVLGVPALFAYGHLADTDMLLTFFWLACVACLELHLVTGREGWLWLSAIALGAACATKFTGLLLVPVAGVWLALDRTLTLRRVAILAGVALAVFVLADPLMWVEPWSELSRYLGAGLSRASSPVAQIPTHYFGHTYVYRPPWHYPIVWSAIVVPLPLLLCVGVAVFAERRDRLVRLAFLDLIVVYGATLVPRAPLHDGIRLILPAFPFLCILAGIGAAVLVRGAERRLAKLGGLRPGFVGASVLALIFVIPARAVVQTHPYELSYFNGLIGGIHGAEAHGLEVTNLKEVMTPSVLDSLARHIPRTAVVDPDFLFEEVCFDRKLGLAHFDWDVETGIPSARGDGAVTVTCDSKAPYGWSVLDRSPRSPDYMMVLNREGVLGVRARLLQRHSRPFYRIALDGVPLLEVFRLVDPEGDGRG